MKNLNKKFNSIKEKHVLVENELNELSKKVEVIVTNGITKDLIIGYKILNYITELFSNLGQQKCILQNPVECQKKKVFKM